MWEDWEGKLSLCHSSYLHVGSWFVEGLAGIQPGPAGQGYHNFILRPASWKACPLEWMKCRFDSPYGPIESAWRRAPTGVDYEFAVPPNSSATLFLPPASSGAESEAGALARAQGVQEQRQGERRALRLESGRHRFHLDNP